MDLAAAIAGRRSTRAYTTEPVDERLIRHLIHAATLAPSAMNEQPWAFTVVRDPVVLDALSHDAKAYGLANLVAAEGSADAARLRAVLGDPGYQIFYHAPALIVISGHAPGAWLTEDCALAAQNLLLSAHAAGLGSCWIGFAQRYLNTPAGKRQLGLPEAEVCVAPLILGYAKAPPAPVSRREPQLRWIG